jgi:Flp pilus assembly protein TadG
MTMERFKQFLRAAPGAVAVEFALIAPVIILLAIGIYDYGNFTVTNQRLSSAAKSAAQYAVVAANPINGCVSNAAYFNAQSASAITPPLKPNCGANSLVVNSDLTTAATIATNSSPAGTTAYVEFYCQCVTSSTTQNVNCLQPNCSAIPVQNFVYVGLSGTYATAINYPGIPASIPMTASVILRRQ